MSERVIGDVIQCEPRELPAGVLRVHVARRDASELRYAMRVATLTDEACAVRGVCVWRGRGRGDEAAGARVGNGRAR